MGSSTTLAGFAQQHPFRGKLDACHDAIVPGKLGHLCQHDAARFGIVLEAPADSTRLDNTLRSRKRRAIAAGFLLNQDGDFEGILLFDPADTKQARLAIRLVQAKKIRRAAQPTDGQLRARALFSSKARSRRSCFDQNASAFLGQRDESRSPAWLVGEGADVTKLVSKGATGVKQYKLYTRWKDCRDARTLLISARASSPEDRITFSRPGAHDAMRSIVRSSRHVVTVISLRSARKFICRSITEDARRELGRRANE
jgi:hypothetical protein